MTKRQVLHSISALYFCGVAGMSTFATTDPAPIDAGPSPIAHNNRISRGDRQWQRNAGTPATDVASPSTTNAPVRRQPRPTGSSVSTAPVQSAEQLRLRIIQCESRGNPLAENRRSSASGLYQYLDSTWNNWGGFARAKDAPEHIQTERFWFDYNRIGTRPWNASRSCWS